MKTKILGALALMLFIVGAPIIFAFDCNSLSQANYNTCVEINNLNLTETEKNLILSNLDYTNNLHPDHNFVYNKNTNLAIGWAPNGVNMYNGIYVRNAWASIFTSMPSILYTDKLYVPAQTVIFTGFNYQTWAPTNYYSPGYPNTNNGDCKTEYNLLQNSAQNDIYVNNQYQGSGKLVSVNINSDSQIKAIYTVNIAYNVNHYTWRRYCSRYENGYCTRYNYRCQYSSNEVKRDNIVITDYLNVNYYKSNLSAEIKKLDSYLGSTKLNLTYKNSVELKFQDSYLNNYEFTYGINYSKAPYYVYTLKAEDYRQEKVNNILKDGTNLIVNNLNNCTLTTFDFFNVLSKPCFLNYAPTNFEIKTDKLNYNLNDTIKVSVYPQNISVNLSYGNQSKIITGNTTLKPESLKNKITASYDTFQTEKIIYVQEQDRFFVFWNLSLFGLINYVCYALLRKGFGGVI